MAFWPTAGALERVDSRDTDHYRVPALEESGVVELSPMPVEVPEAEWMGLEYMDWKSGGDTNFAPLASADGELDCRGFWTRERPTRTRCGRRTRKSRRRFAATSMGSAPTSVGFG